MKFLLTSAGITNDSIRKALVNLLGKPKVDVSLYAFDDQTAIKVIDGEVVSEGQWKRLEK